MATTRPLLPTALLVTTLLVTTLLIPAGCTVPASTPPSDMLRHVVLFKFKAGTTPQEVRTIEDKFRGLPERIPSIVDFEWGTDISVEGKADGFTHCFLVTFADAAGREAYSPHAAHQEFVALVGPALDKVLVIDYAATR